MNERRAKVFINPSSLAPLLDLPEGMTVQRVYATNDPMGIVVEVASPALAKVPENTEAPTLAGWWDTLRHFHDGKPWVRWGWARE